MKSTLCSPTCPATHTRMFRYISDEDNKNKNILFVISLYTVSWGRSLSNVASMFIATMCNDLFFHVSFNIG